jgi:hypothetical protein
MRGHLVSPNAVAPLQGVLLVKPNIRMVGAPLRVRPAHEPEHHGRRRLPSADAGKLPGRPRGFFPAAVSDAEAGEKAHQEVQ